MKKLFLLLCIFIGLNANPDNYLLEAICNNSWDNIYLALQAGANPFIEYKGEVFFYSMIRSRNINLLDLFSRFIPFYPDGNNEFIETIKLFHEDRSFWIPWLYNYSKNTNDLDQFYSFWLPLLSNEWNNENPILKELNFVVG